MATGSHSGRIAVLQLALTLAACMGSRETGVSGKLGPEIAEMLNRGACAAEAGDAPVEVLIGLDQPLNSAVRADLEARGLTVRSDIGDVLTGTIRPTDMERVAQSPRVVKIDASRPMRAEGGEGYTPK